MDPDLRARRADNVFYQNPEDQLHFRDMVDIDPDPVNQVPGLLEMSNPRGENFQKWAEGQVLPTYSQIINRLKDLKLKKHCLIQ